MATNEVVTRTACACTSWTMWIPPHHKRQLWGYLHGQYQDGAQIEMVLLVFVGHSHQTIHTYNRYTHWNWQHHNTITILQDHYTNIIRNTDTSINNPTALDIATGWARKRYGPRLSTETLQETHRLLRINQTHQQPEHHLTQKKNTT